jgi:hypothetical protein
MISAATAVAIPFLLVTEFGADACRHALRWGLWWGAKEAFYASRWVWRWLWRDRVDHRRRLPPPPPSPTEPEALHDEDSENVQIIQR